MKCGNWFVAALLLLSCFVALPSLQAQNMTEEEAELLEKLLHNQIELVLRPYFMRAKLEAAEYNKIEPQPRT